MPGAPLAWNTLAVWRMEAAMTGVRRLVLRALALNALASVPPIGAVQASPHEQRAWDSLIRALFR